MQDKSKEDILFKKRHSLAHIMLMAIKHHFPHAIPTLGPVIDNGFFYDIDFSTSDKITQEDLQKIEKTMREIISRNLDFKVESIPTFEAKGLFKNNPYKLEIIDAIEKDNKEITLYQTGDDFFDLCEGPHIDNTKEIIPDSFKLDKLAGAYWRGDEKNPMLTRIYGLAFNTKEELDTYITQQEEAKKRDHRIIGKQLDLFTFSDLVGSGLPLYTPRGTLLRELLGGFSENLQKSYGFKKVWIPHITKTDLYKTSGHFDKFGDELFLVTSQESSDSFVLKPMNCPHHTQIFASQPRSYRDLPIRYMETTTCYRDEKTGELSGLSRVRSLTQDDAHVFCTMEQIETEFQNIMQMIKTLYGALGMSFKARLSFSDPNNMDKYLGSREDWNKSESIIEEIAKKLELNYFISPGEAAFYGPKIDILVVDALGREWQCATQQLDFVQPSRFKLEYTDKDGTRKTPIMIHKALLGTIDRFMSVYIEHTAGNFPLWLSPTQVTIIPIAEKHHDYAKDVFKKLEAKNIRVELDDSKDGLGKKVRYAKEMKNPYWIVIGDKDIEANMVTLESRDNGQIGQMNIDDVVDKLVEEIENKK